MNPVDLIFNAVYRPSLAAGVRESAAKDAAIKAIDDYKKNKFKNLKDLIDSNLKLAKKL